MPKLIKRITYNLSFRKNPEFILWAIFFSYSVCMALFFQRFILPHLQVFQTGSGLISNDTAYFDSVASNLATQIREHGWSSWRLYPDVGAPGNVAILGALYALFGHDPSLAIPVNAGLHALGGVLIFALAIEFTSHKKTGLIAGVVAATLFIIFPSSIAWYGQNHKDTYAIAGILLTLLVWTRALKGAQNYSGFAYLLLLHLVALILIMSVRPFLLKIFLIFNISIFIFFIVNSALKKSGKRFQKQLILFLMFFICTFGALHLSKVSGSVQSDNVYEGWEGSISLTGQGDSWHWKDNPWLPDSIENYIKVAASTRAGLINYGVFVKAKSMIDGDVAPKSISEVLSYLPRAFQVASLAPFPSSWVESKSLVRIASSIEMFLYYLTLPGVLILIYYNRRMPVILGIIFSVFFLVIYGFTEANLGTLYRHRYAFTFVILTLGVSGWVTLLEKLGSLDRLLARANFPILQNSSENDTHTIRTHSRKGVISSGTLVMAITFITFLGFFVRDVLIAKSYGLGVSMDSFYIALLIPMFVVSVLCMPLGAALVPLYTKLQAQNDINGSKRLVSGVSFWATSVLFLLCLGLYFLGPTLFQFISPNASSSDISHLSNLWYMALLILFFSGFIIIGNAVLNANNQGVASSIGQLGVPFVAVMALFLTGSYGIESVMFGMMIGQLINLIFVQHKLRSINISLIPKFHTDILNVNFLFQYFSLVVSALLISGAAPLATFLAMSLPEGGVSAFNLGNKVVLFITGLLGVAINTIMLPYFSNLISKNHVVSANRELSFFLLLATYISIPISVCMYIWAEIIIRLLFQGGSFDIASTQLVTHVMQYSVIQLPFFLCNTLMIKFATASKHLSAICITAVLGIIVNLLSSLFLMKYMGVVGIVFGSSISIIFSTVALVFLLFIYKKVSKLDGLILLLNWFLFIALLTSVHFGSEPSFYTIIFAYILLLTTYLTLYQK